MGVIGDNIANVKTVGFKSNMVTFANVLGQVIEGNTVGNGTKIWEVASTWIQGAPETTGNATDLAINGKGLFMVNDADGTTYYTRAGQFHFDKDRYLINPDGLRLQGYSVDAATGAVGAISDIQYANSPPLMTSEVRTTINLDADAVIGDTFMTVLTVYDSLGSPIDLTINFENTGPGAWNWTANPSSGTSASGGTLSFDSDGVLAATGDETIDITGLQAVNGAEDTLSLNWAFTSGTPAASDGTITGYATDSATTYLAQNGYPAGILQSVSVDEEGYVYGLYSNGEQEAIFRVALADFPNYQGLNIKGNNLFTQSLASGQRIVGYPSDGRLGSLSPGALEMSNVDLSREFVNLITTQRAYQANSKVIITSDEMLAELMNIKR